MAEWCTIESDPAVFEEMTRSLGVEGVCVREIYTLEYDPLLYTALEPVYGFVFLFKWVALPHDEESVAIPDPQPFFATQVVQNACATQALLSVVLNLGGQVELGEKMRQFKEFCTELDPYSRGLAIGETEFIRDAHNSFSTRKFFEVEATRGESKDDAFHFIAFVPHQGIVCELDGLKKAPRGIKPASAGEHWVETTLTHISRRISAYGKGEIRFTLLALTQDPRVRLREERVRLQEKASCLSKGGDSETLAAIHQRLAEVDDELTCRNQEVKLQTEENARRKHNYLPLIFALLEKAATAGRLEGMLEEACLRVGNSSS